MTRYGYCRVSTTDQSLDRQVEALKAAGCQEIYQEKISGKNDKRPELQKMLKRVKEGDTVVVMKLDRLGRSLRDLIQIVKDLGERKVQFISLGESIDTTSPVGQFIFHIMGALAEFERNLILERVNGGIAHAKKHGTKTGNPFGRVPTKGTPENFGKLKRMVNKGDHVKDIAKELDVDTKEVYRYMRRLGIRELYSQKQKEKAGL